MSRLSLINEQLDNKLAGYSLCTVNCPEYAMHKVPYYIPATSCKDCPVYTGNKLYFKELLICLDSLL